MFADMVDDEEEGEDWADDDSDFVPIGVAVVAAVTPEQIQAALEEYLEDDGDLGGYEIKGARTAKDGTLYVEAEVLVEAGMSAMEWQSSLSGGAITIGVELRVLPVYELEKHSDAKS